MRVNLVRIWRRGGAALGFLALLAAISGVAMAEHPKAPEIDPGSMANALLVLGGATLMASSRRPRK